MTQPELLTIIQRDFPITPRPFAALAQRLDTTEADLLNRVISLQKQGLIRRIAGTFELALASHVSTLVGAQVPAASWPQWLSAVNDLPSVSHHYQRDHTVNSWFTLTMPQRCAILAQLTALNQAFPAVRLWELPTVKRYKIRVFFPAPTSSSPSPQSQLPDNPSPAPSHPAPAAAPLSFTPWQRQLVRHIQQGIPLTPSPYADIASTLSIDQSQVLTALHHWQDQGFLRRFGASLRHIAAGFTANALLLTAYQNPADIDTAGSHLASFDWLSHCYQRQRRDHWPWDIYAMIHAHNSSQLHQRIQQALDAIPPHTHQILTTVKELKKAPALLFPNHNASDTVTEPSR